MSAPIEREVSWKMKAGELVGDVYENFMTHVVERFVVNERNGQLGIQQQQKVEENKQIDPRVIRLMSISGKGGWHPEPQKAAEYSTSTNITLLDHLLSVVRGGMVLYALDCLELNPGMDEELLKQRLSEIAALAFLHDADKILELERGSELTVAMMSELMSRYGIQEFLTAAGGQSPTAEQFRYLIEKVEASQAWRHIPSELPDQHFEALCGFVGLADKLDGIWLSSEAGAGLEGVMKRLRDDVNLRGDTLRHWKVLDIFDPHHPYLLDEFQSWCSAMSSRLTGIYPLIETHMDGRLFMLLPEAEYELIIEKSIAKLCQSLPFDLELSISNRGMPALFNGKPGHADLRSFLATKVSARDIGRLFLVKATLKNTLTKELDPLLKELNLSPAWSEGEGALLSPYPQPDFSKLSQSASDCLLDAAHLALVLNLNIDLPKNFLSAPERERQLLECVGMDRPEWLIAIDDPASRRTMTALWLAARAAEDTELRGRVWGEEGLLKAWLEGQGDTPGLNCFIKGRGPVVSQAVRDRFEALVAKRHIEVKVEGKVGHCLFTAEPVPFNDTIDSALGLYEVKVSAFSGRDNRPETLTSEIACTHVGPVSVAEHKLRSKVHARQGGKPDGVPVLVSSPASVGLFGGISFHGDHAMRGMSIYDLSRQEVKNGTVFRGSEHLRSRYRLANFTTLPDKTEKQADQIRMLLQACCRTGRPIHVFRGLPTPTRAFFHYDAMPRVLSDLIGGHSLRLEQIPKAIQRLNTAQAILESHGLGYEMLRYYASPNTHFGAVCLAWCHIRGDEKKAAAARGLANDYFNCRENQKMNAQDNALVRFGEAATMIQRRPLYQAAANEEMLTFNVCMDFVQSAHLLKQMSTESLINGIASELEVNLVRKTKAAASKYRDDMSLREGCLSVAKIFVNEVWLGAMQSRLPSQKIRRTLGSIYRMSFLMKFNDLKTQSE